MLFLCGFFSAVSRKQYRLGYRNPMQVSIQLSSIPVTQNFRSGLGCKAGTRQNMCRCFTTFACACNGFTRQAGHIWTSSPATCCGGLKCMPGLSSILDAPLRSVRPHLLPFELAFQSITACIPVHHSSIVQSCCASAF
jgi:hypothetical protein